ncbi:MAG TPA: protein-L-isoaspartate(D-aspartate) O-methyltransferase [Gemmataceae bacterium]|nr:protein-L-isoaspartate(D-aspartate) O-methyltransferase [Gemmataceae bacterium]
MIQRIGSVRGCFTMVHCATLLTLSLSAIIAWYGLSLADEPDSYAAARQKMVEDDIEREGISNPAVLKALRQVPRHLFVSPEYRSKAYYDQALPIGHKQTITPPYLVAYMTALLDPQPSDRVLEIGTGCGYQAAVLSQIVKEVYSIEIIEALGKQAAERLRELGYTNVHVKIGDGYKGWPEQAPFDKIIVTCSPESVPQPLIDQLRDGGKMILPLGERYQQAFHLLEKRDGKLVQTRLVPTLFVPMTGKAEDLRKTKPDPLHPRIRNGGFEEQSDGQLDAWYHVRQTTIEQGGAPEGKVYVTFANAEPGRTAGILQGIGVNGMRVKSLRLSLWVKAERAAVGDQATELPGLALHFYDGESRPVGTSTMGPWLRSFHWKYVTAEVLVPPQAQVAILSIGLNGGTGKLSVDDLKMVAKPR